MEGALKEVGNLAGMIGSRARLLILGVLTPGFLLLCEALAVVFWTDISQQGALIAWLTKNFGSQSFALALLVMLVLAVSYVLGYISRETTFALSTAWLRHGWPPARYVSKMLEQMRFIYGSDKVDSVIGQYKVFELANHEADYKEHGLIRPPEFYVREYCKLWLRTKVPALSTDHMEAEINLVVGFIAPVLFVAPCVVARHGQIGPYWTAATAVIALLFAVRLFYTINGVRGQETEEAIINFLYAHWEGLADKPKPSMRVCKAALPR
ncbi:hypothetical protein [Caballeronia grimmiae]|uniref:Uncharacterized protein n=1 Tax=Caballeronia grimmiae TaxID=1071679 RepID=A0A069P8Q7_9BURK|nr:hypothetical protein [Caballeronia grimmiae]KDR37028.1 hypothetical protein BG57_09990 [Caballeronia grimmiae]GGD78151.1 hypothetical protein GCM10010985_35840 [Caballeronia grimmiae]